MLGISCKLLMIRDFLFGRTKCVKVARDVSSLREVTSGVIQGSVLGHILFII